MGFKVPWPGFPLPGLVADGAGSIVPQARAFLLFCGAARSRGFPLRGVEERGQEGGAVIVALSSGHLKRTGKIAMSNALLFLSKNLIKTGVGRKGIEEN